MGPVFISKIDRPALGAALAERGLVPVQAAAGAVAALIPDHAPRPACPAVLQASSVRRANALLDEGAEDVVLPTDPDSLVAARIAALVRRSHSGMLRIGDIEIDPVERRVTRGGKQLPLLPREYALLHYLARHAGTAVDHATLHRALWGRDFDPGTNVIAVHVSRLRAKLGDGGVTVLTDRGKGYRLALPIAADDHGD